MVLLSIIIPEYNCEKYIRQAIYSVLKQPCDDYEIIVVDDGSTDNSLKIASEIEKQHNCVKVFHQNNKGVSCARNFGISQAKGLYISFLDADDVYCNNLYTETIKQCLLSNKFDAIKFSYITSDVTLKRGNTIKFNSNEFTNTDYDFSSQFRDPVPSYFYKNETVLQTLLFPEGVAYGEDMIFQFMFAKIAQSITVCERPAFIYRSNPKSSVHTTNLYYAKINEIKAWAKYRGYARIEEKENT